MLEKAFEMSVVISVIDHFTGPMRALESSMVKSQRSVDKVSQTMKALGSTSKEIEKVTSSLNKMQAKQDFAKMASDLKSVGMQKAEIDKLEESFMRLHRTQQKISETQASYGKYKGIASSGVATAATGVAGGYGIFQMVEKAGEFQNSMIVIQDSTGASAKEMNKFGDAVINASAQVSKFNDMQMAQIAQTLTSGGFNKIGQAQSLMLPVAKFAEAQLYEHKASDPIEVTKQMIEMSHLFGHYDPKSFGNFLNTFNKYSLMQPGDSMQLQQTLKYLAPTANSMHMKESDIMALAAVDNTLGLSGSHGGTNSADMILRLIPGLVGGRPTKKKTPRAWAAMEQLGFIDSNGNSKFFDKKGNLTNLKGMLNTMITDGKKYNPMELTALYKDIFGIQGGRAANILANPRSLEQLKKMSGQLSKTKNVDTIHKDLQKSTIGQLDQMGSNSLSIMIRLGGELSIALNPALTKINAILGSLLKFSEAHKGVTRLVGDFALFAVGGTIATGMLKTMFGSVGMLVKGFKLMKLTSEAGEVTRFGKIMFGLRGQFLTVSTGIKMFAKSAGSGFLTAIKALGSGTLTVMKVLGKFGIGLAKIGIQAAAWAVRMAASWLVAMGPVGWIIAGVTAVIAAGVLAWTTNFLGFRDKITQVWNWCKANWKILVMAAINPIPAIIFAVLKLLPKQAQDWGKNMMKMLASGITSGISWVGNAVKNVAGKIKSFLGFHSPTKEGPASESDVWMPNMMNMFAGGINKNIPKLARASKKAALTLQNHFAGGIGGNGNISPIIGGGHTEIHIHPHPNQRADEIADEVIRKLGKTTRRMSMNTTSRVNVGAF